MGSLQMSQDPRSNDTSSLATSISMGRLGYTPYSGSISYQHELFLRASLPNLFRLGLLDIQEWKKHVCRACCRMSSQIDRTRGRLLEGCSMEFRRALRHCKAVGVVESPGFRYCTAILLSKLAPNIARWKTLNIRP